MHAVVEIVDVDVVAIMIVVVAAGVIDDDVCVVEVV